MVYVYYSPFNAILDSSNKWLAKKLKYLIFCAKVFQNKLVKTFLFDDLAVFDSDFSQFLTGLLHLPPLAIIYNLPLCSCWAGGGGWEDQTNGKVKVVGPILIMLCLLSRLLINIVYRQLIFHSL